MKQVPRANYLQSMPFARALRMQDQKVTRLALICIGEEKIGMMAIQEIKVGPVHVIYLYRGPMWFQENPPEEWFAAFAQLFNQTFPRRLLRRRRWLPEWRDGAYAQKVLLANGFRSKAQSYETVWLDLEKSESEIRSQFKTKWRHALTHGERADLKVHADWTGASAKVFLNRYEADRLQKKYQGRSAKFIAEEIKTAVAFKDMVILLAFKGDELLAGILILLHGNSASYRVGWTTEDGRKYNANRVLLWEAVKILKKAEVHYFDLGGVEPSSAQGLTKFKEGMGGETFKSVGLFR